MYMHWILIVKGILKVFVERGDSVYFIYKLLFPKLRHKFLVQELVYLTIPVPHIPGLFKDSRVRSNEGRDIFC